MQEFQCFSVHIVYFEMTRIKSNMNQNYLIQVICYLSYLEMTWEVLLVKSMIVNLDLGESSEVIWHEHDRHVDVLQLPNHSILDIVLIVSKLRPFLCFLHVFLTRAF